MWNVVPCSFEAPYTLTYTYRYIYMHLEGLVTLWWEKKGLGDMEEGRKENVCQRKEGRGVSANCLFSIPRCHRQRSQDIFQILTGKVRTP